MGRRLDLAIAQEDILDGFLEALDGLPDEDDEFAAALVLETARAMLPERPLASAIWRGIGERMGEDRVTVGEFRRRTRVALESLAAQESS